MVRGMAHTRRLSWDGCYNIRDLGGFRTAGGEDTRLRALVRSDNLSRLTHDGWEALMAYGIRTVLDLRTTWERTIELSPFLDKDSRVRYLHIPFLSDDRVMTWPHTASIEEDYRLMLREARTEVGAIVQALARAEDGGVLFYCHTGKDRTGLIAALLLAVLGVPHDDVADDYAVSLECLRPLQAEWLEHGPGERSDREAEDAKFSARPEIMQAVLRHVEEEYGGAEAYLEGAGVLPDDIEHLRRRLIEPN